MQPTPAPGHLDRRRLLATAAGLGLAGGCAASPSRLPDPAKKSEEELQEIFSDLGDQSSRWHPISVVEKRPRLARLASELAKTGLDALLIEPGVTLQYLCDVRWGRSERLFALVVLADGTCFWVTPAFEAPRAQRRIESSEGPEGELVTWDEHEYAWEPLAAALRARGVERIAIEPEARAFVAQRLADAFGTERVVAGHGVVRGLRGQKDARELELLRGASELTQRAIRAVAERLRPGLTDHEVGRWIGFAQERLGLRGTWVLPLLGPSAAYPHGEPEGRVLERGAGILVDTGGSLHGYQSDTTRSWSFGPAADAEFGRAWGAVRRAQEAAFERVKPGVTALEIDRVARAAIEGAGYPGGYAVFGHRLGHGIGLQGHEEPYLDGGNEVVLAPGMTFSNEPGIYIAGRIGVRLEDIMVVTQSGADHFGTWQESPDKP